MYASVKLYGASSVFWEEAAWPKAFNIAMKTAKHKANLIIIIIIITTTIIIIIMIIIII